jgi:hypothetical protein
VTFVSWTEVLGKVAVKITGPLGAATEALTAPDMEQEVVPRALVLQSPLELLPVKLRDTAAVPPACWLVTAAAAAQSSTAFSQTRWPIRAYTKQCLQVPIATYLAVQSLLYLGECVTRQTSMEESSNTQMILQICMWAT